MQNQQKNNEFFKGHIKNWI